MLHMPHFDAAYRTLSAVWPLPSPTRRAPVCVPPTRAFSPSLPPLPSPFAKHGCRTANAARSPRPLQKIDLFTPNCAAPPDALFSLRSRCLARPAASCTPRPLGWGPTLSPARRPKARLLAPSTSFSRCFIPPRLFSLHPSGSPPAAARRHISTPHLLSAPPAPTFEAISSARRTSSHNSLALSNTNCLSLSTPHAKQLPYYCTLAPRQLPVDPARMHPKSNATPPRELYPPNA